MNVRRIAPENMCVHSLLPLLTDPYSCSPQYPIRRCCILGAGMCHRKTKHKISPHLWSGDALE